MSKNLPTTEMQKSPRGSDYYISAESPVGISAEQLRARLYATSEIHTDSRPQLKFARRRSNTDVSPGLVIWRLTKLYPSLEL